MSNKTATFLGKAIGNVFAFALIYFFVIFVSLPILIPVVAYAPEWIGHLLLEIEFFIALLVMDHLKAKRKRKNSRLH